MVRFRLTDLMVFSWIVLVCFCFLYSSFVFFFFFFFQAEDGIRDPLVTGVQTCALPISCPEAHVRQARVSAGCEFLSESGNWTASGECFARLSGWPRSAGSVDRSEERRVGKECRSWWSAYH